MNLCHDIALALSYLHSNGIIHRDLSSNNVLLIGAGNRAKVADFGMAKFFCTTRSLQTRHPGTKVYMAPEALDYPPLKVGLHAFHLVCWAYRSSLAYISQPWPSYKPPHGSRCRQVFLGTERRKSYIDLIDPTHPLLPIATDCLSNNEEDRPSAPELCHHLAVLKQSGATWKEKLTLNWKRAT